jgi:hypothetical protein
MSPNVLIDALLDELRTAFVACVVAPNASRLPIRAGLLGIL